MKNKFAVENVVLTTTCKKWNVTKKPDFLISHIKQQQARGKPLIVDSLEKFMEILRTERVGEHLETLDVEKWLSYKERARITDENLAEILKLCPNITKLSLQGCNQITDLAQS